MKEGAKGNPTVDKFGLKPYCAPGLVLEFCSLGVIKPQIQVSGFSYANLRPLSQMRKLRPNEGMHLSLRAGG